MRGAIIALLILMFKQLHAAIDYDREQIQQRISPIGKVHVQEPAKSRSAPEPSQAEKESTVKKEPGQTIYEQYCSVCHRDGIANAPKFRNAADWASRIAKQNIDSLTTTVIKGLNAMPSKGTCQECSESDIKAAVEYMVPPK